MADSKNTSRKRATQGSAKRVIARPPAARGWQSTDADEIERRKWRGQTEIAAVEPLEPGEPYLYPYCGTTTR